MTKVNIVTKQEYEQQFADIFLLLIPIQSFVSLELIANIGQLFVDSFDLSFLAFTCEWVNKSIRMVTS